MVGDGGKNEPINQSAGAAPFVSAGLHINLIADNSVAGAPSGFASAIRTAADIIEASFSDAITVNLRYGWGSYNNVADPSLVNSGGAYAQALAGQVVGYSTVRSWLAADSKSTQDASTILALPASNASFPGGNNNFFVTSAQEKALGHFSGNSSAVDGAAAFGTATSSAFWVGIALHELTHAMGRVTLHYETNPVILDMFRYDAAGHFQWTEGNSSAAPSYFSINGGATRLADFGRTSDYSDFLNSGVQGTSDAFNEFYGSGTLQTLSSIDITTMDVIGFDRAGSSSDDYPANASTSGRVVVGGAIGGNLEIAGDHDWFKVDLTAALPYVIQLDGTTLTDPFLRIYSPTLALLASDDDSGPGLNSRLTFTPSGSGTYYIDAGGFNDGAAGSYAVSVNGFTQVSLQLSAFGTGNAAGGWSSDDTYPRHLADVNGDGRADIVGFGNAGVYVALATGSGHFAAPSFALTAFGSASSAGGWSSDTAYPRELADVNGDGRADIVGFGNTGVWVALATSNGGFAAPSFSLAAFGVNAGGWSSDTAYPRELADVNGDSRADIVGFGSAGVWVALATSNGGFAAPFLSLGAFGASASAGGWSSDTTYPRLLADVNGDHLADIIGFGNAGVYVSLATGAGHFAAPSFSLAAFGSSSSAGGWVSNDTYPRELADINADGLADIVAFGNNGVLYALATGGGHFGAPDFDLPAVGYSPDAGSWNSDTTYPRELADLTGDHRADIVGFGNAGVYVSISDFLI